MAEVVTFEDSIRAARFVPDNTALPLAFDPLQGDVTVEATIGGAPFEVTRDPETDREVRVNTATLEVLAFAPGAAQPTKRQPVTLRSQEPLKDKFLASFPIPASARGWRVEILNKCGKQIHCAARVIFEGAREVEATRLPLRTLNHALRRFLEVLGPQARIGSGRGEVRFSPDLGELLGESLPTFSLELPDAFVIDVDVNDLNVATLKLRAGRGRGGLPAVRLLVDFETVGETEITSILGDVDLTEASIEIEMTMGVRPGRRARGRIEPRFFVTAHVEAEKSRRATLVSEILDKDTDDLVREIERKVGDLLNDEDVTKSASRYLSAGFAELANRDHVLHDLTVEGSAFIVRHFDPDRLSSGKSGGILNPPGPSQPLEPHQSPPFLNQLGRVDTFVVLMQENRSFDHMLGYLHRAGRPKVDGLRRTERNEMAGGLVVPVRQLRDTFFPESPQHSHRPVLGQIDDGAMSGFLASFVESYPNTSVDPADPRARSPMSFHGAHTVDMFDFLAEHYLICNRWFCSVPGPTQPNRFCTLSGETPSLDNLDITDPDIGFLALPTIFELLSQAEDFDWVYYEHDVAFLRFYDRYRLDNRHVVPFNDPRDGFFARARDGSLPQVTFIDPDFVDIPPFATANDDHPPADIAHGQDLIADIYDALVRSPQWPATMFIITYDEHGGFYDHVPPPGTRVANELAALPGQPVAVDPVHPHGEAFFGVRVPTLIASPLVDAGSVSDVIFDHTSIGRSLLLRYLGPNAPSLGRRMGQAHHLGAVIKKGPARTDRPIFTRPVPPPDLPPDDIPPGGHLEGPPRPARPPRRSSAPHVDEFHETMRRFGRPIRLR